MIRVYDAAGNVIETHELAGDFEEPRAVMFAVLSERLCTAELSNFAEGASKSPRPKRDLVTIPIFGSLFCGGTPVSGGGL